MMFAGKKNELSPPERPAAATAGNVLPQSKAFWLKNILRLLFSPNKHQKVAPYKYQVSLKKLTF